MSDPLSQAELERLKRSWSAYWPSADIPRMAADVHARLIAAIEVWRLADVHALLGGVVALVCAATRHGRPVVLKLNPRGHADDAQLAGEGTALDFWYDTGAVPRLIGMRDHGFTMLMQRLRPGRTLDGSNVSWEKRLVLLARLARRLHAAGSPPSTFMHIGHFGRGWRRALAGDPPLLDELDDLLAPCAADVLVHADLHGANALRDGDTWKVIDPKALRGDPHADIWALIDPLAPELPDDSALAVRTAQRWVEHYARAAGMDISRASAWTRVRARAEACEIDAQKRATSNERAWALRLHRMADLLAG